MTSEDDHTDEHTQLISPRARIHSVQSDVESILSSHLSRDEQALADTAVGERLAYNDYTTIDWLHDLVRYGPYRKVPIPAYALLHR